MRTLRFADACYTVAYDGYDDPMPVVSLFGRDQHRQRHHVRLHQKRPYFLVPEDEAMQMADQLQNDERLAEPPIQSYDEDDRPELGMDGERLVRINTLVPWDVPKLRENFENPMEADVPFTDRVLVDLGIKQGFRVPDGEGPFTPDQIAPANDHPVTETPLRILFFDIEVAQGGDGPAVVTKQGTEQARNPVTAISAYDSYTESYTLFLLVNETWTENDVSDVRGACKDFKGYVDLQLFSTDSDLLRAFCTYVSQYDFDVLTAFNGNAFDVPYVVNRCYTEDVAEVDKLGVVGDVDEMHGEGRYLNRDLNGRVCFDLLDGYKKSRVKSLDSNRLEAVAEEETDVEKLDVGDLDDAWRDDPVAFVRYSLRDTESLWRINESVGII